MPAHVVILNAPEVDPAVRELVSEKRGEAEVRLALKLAPAVAGQPRGPGVPLQRMRRRRQRDEVGDHRLVVAAPVVGEVAAFRVPAVSDGRRADLRPAPVGPGVQRIHERAQFRFLRRLLIKIGLAEERPGQEQSRVDGGQLDVPESQPGFGVEEVVVEAVEAGGAGGRGVLRRIAEEPQRRHDSCARLVPRDPCVFDADRVGGERETRGADAHERMGRPPVRHQTRARIGPVPEEAEGACLERVEEGFTRCLRRGIGEDCPRGAGRVPPGLRCAPGREQDGAKQPYSQGRDEAPNGAGPGGLVPSGLHLRPPWASSLRNPHPADPRSGAAPDGPGRPYPDSLIFPAIDNTVCI